MTVGQGRSAEPKKLIGFCLQRKEARMIRRFAEGFRRPHPNQLREWFQGEMVTPDGTIVSDEAYIVLREFFFDPQANISAMEISNRTFMDPFQVRSLCRQLATHRIIEESPAFSTRFQVAHAKLTARVLERLASQFRPVWKEAA